ncbi:unnamed protein product [Lactuca saligna]|uniref:Uncharacterized protein n=1 Tax=Lactuca saligna TaxID=75948 RepID=A0AA35ZLE5_LACSI|nr:unnamed protein product [Lactuca saligna]
MNYILGAFKPSYNISVTLNDVPLKKDHGQISMVPRFQSQESIVGVNSLVNLKFILTEATSMTLPLFTYGEVMSFLQHCSHIRQMKKFSCYALSYYPSNDSEISCKL